MSVQNRWLTNLAEAVRRHKANLPQWFRANAQLEHECVDQGEPDLVAHRFLLLHFINYQDDLDNFASEGADTLDEAKAAVEAHLFPDLIREGYEYVSIVIDLETGKDVPFDTVQEIRWQTPTTT